MKNSYLVKQVNHGSCLPEPIHVMHVIDKLSVSGSGVHGITKALEWWIPRFDPQQFKFTICSLRSPEVAGEILAQKGIKVFFLNKGKFNPSTLTSLVALIKREQVHILHLHGYGATNFGRMASLLTDLPNIVHEHAVLPHQPLYQTVADLILSPLTTKAIAISEPVREYMIHHRKVKPKKLETFFYGLPLAEFQPAEPTEVDKKRTELGIFPEEQVVCNVGRLDTQKGQIYLLKAAISILKELPQTRFLMVGEGPDRSMLQSFAQQAGIAERIIFTGFRQDVPTILAMSDIAAIPSISEGGPLTLFEAMNLRKPVVGTPVGLMEEVIDEGETGFLIPCHNVSLLAKKLIFLLKNPQLARSMGEKGWKKCQDYDIIHSVGRLSKLYGHLSNFNRAC